MSEMSKEEFEKLLGQVRGKYIVIWPAQMFEVVVLDDPKEPYEYVYKALDPIPAIKGAIEMYKEKHK